MHGVHGRLQQTAIEQSELSAQITARQAHQREGPAEAGAIVGLFLCLLWPPLLGPGRSSLGFSAIGRVLAVLAAEPGALPTRDRRRDGQWAAPSDQSLAHVCQPGPCCIPHTRPARLLVRLGVHGWRLRNSGDEPPAGETAETGFLWSATLPSRRALMQPSRPNLAKCRHVIVDVGGRWSRGVPCFRTVISRRLCVPAAPMSWMHLSSVAFSTRNAMQQGRGFQMGEIHGLNLATEPQPLPRNACSVVKPGGRRE